MAGYAVYRLPKEDICTFMIQSEGEPLKLESCNELDGHHGFVIAPFVVGTDKPILLLQPDVVNSYGCVDCVPENLKEIADNISVLNISSVFGADTKDEEREHYSCDFKKFHERLRSGDFSKIVLARRTTVKTSCETSPFELFRRACMLYPRMFIALFSTPQSGTWLMATPEVLLENTDNMWHTIALAGTMKLEGDSLHFDVPVGNGADSMSMSERPAWSDKNIQEQRFVATYIKECISCFSDNVSENGPYTARAGNLVHLRSDFSFTLADNAGVGRLLDMLHPTPAVCGLPKNETFDFIVNNEHNQRGYYSGFAGPLCAGGLTHLYVSLRCMHINDSRIFHLYAGGGLLKESIEEQEWNETEAKMETMRKILNN